MLPVPNILLLVLHFQIAETDSSLKEDLQEWFGDVLKICDQYLSSIILSENPG